MSEENVYAVSVYAVSEAKYKRSRSIILDTKIRDYHHAIRSKLRRSLMLRYRDKFRYMGQAGFQGVPTAFSDRQAWVAGSTTSLILSRVSAVQQGNRLTPGWHV